jgi:Uma2 family endonuclease
MERCISMSIEDFEQAADALGPCELVRGKVIPMVPGGFFHSNASANILTLLRVHCRKVKCGRVIGNEAGVVTEDFPGTVRGADVLYISYKRRPKNHPNPGFVRQIPELTVEVLGVSDSWKKLEEKVAEYHKLGVDLVWVADPKSRSVCIYPKGGKPVLKHENETIDGGKVLPKFKCKIARFFED